MADLVGIDLRARQRQRGLEALERLQHALGRLAGRLEIGDGGTVGGRLLAALVAEQAAPRRLAAADRETATGLREFARLGRRTGNDRADAEKPGDDRHRLGARELFAQPVLVAAGDVARLVCDDADDLVRRLGLQQRAGVDEHATAGDEGVEARIVDQNDVDAGFREAGGLEDRARIVAHQRLDLGVAHDRHVLRKGRTAGDEGDSAGKRAHCKSADGAEKPEVWGGLLHV